MDHDHLSGSDIPYEEFLLLHTLEADIDSLSEMLLVLIYLVELTQGEKYENMKITIHAEILLILEFPFFILFFLQMYLTTGIRDCSQWGESSMCPE